MSFPSGRMNIGIYAVIFGILYWPVESLLHTLFIKDATIFDAFFRTGLDEAWMRLLISISFIAFGIYTNRTIQQQRELNRTLLQQKDRVRQVIDSAHDAYIAIDSNSVITDWNPMAEKLFGWSRNHAVGKPLVETVVPERFHQAHTHGMQTYLKSGGGPWLYRTVVTTARHKDGKEFDIDMAIVPLSSDGEKEFYAFVRKAK
jgi:PAS domain S-box-containing protein